MKTGGEGLKPENSRIITKNNTESLYENSLDPSTTIRPNSPYALKARIRNMKIALTGATGLIGSRFFDLLKGKYEIIPISSSYGVDITDRNKLRQVLSGKNPALIVHLAAKTDVDACEKDREGDSKKLKKSKLDSGEDLNFENLDVDDWNGSTSAFGVNVVGTKNLADFAEKHDVQIIYISTDFIFDGDKEGFYTEEDTASPINWYGKTKFWGERTLDKNSIIARISYPFGYRSPLKKDLIWTLIDLISKGGQVKLVSDQIITPTFIDDIVRALDFLIEKKTSGIFNVVGNNFFSPYELGVLLTRELGISDIGLELTTRAALYEGKAPRPFKIRLKNDKLRDLGFEMTDFLGVLKQIKKDL